MDQHQSDQPTLKTSLAAPTLLRRFHFSLRTFFIALTVISIGFGWIAKAIATIHHRRTMLQQISVSGGLTSSKFHCVNRPRQFQQLPQEVRGGEGSPTVPVLRYLLGDRPIGTIMFDRRLTAADEHVIAAFPEARIFALPTVD
jgi:hypothetical protein